MRLLKRQSVHYKMQRSTSTESTSRRCNRSSHCEAQVKKLMEKVQQLEHKPIQEVPKAGQVLAKRQGKLTVAVGVLRPNQLVNYVHNKLHRWYDDDPEPCLGMLPDESVIHSGLITVPSDWIEPGLEYCSDEQDKSTETT